MKNCMLFITLGLLLSGCSTNIDVYESNKPVFIAEDFFNGSLTAHGIVKNRSGKVVRSFNATLQGSWHEGEGLLAERFVFDDGEVQLRNWTLSPEPIKGRYIAGAEDVLGDAEINTAGNAMFINYTLVVPYNDTSIEVQVDDRMYLVSDKVLINESKLTKWGFDVGEVVLTIIKTD